MPNGEDSSIDELWMDELNFIWKELKNSIREALKQECQRNELKRLVIEESNQLKKWLGILERINSEKAQEQKANINEILKAIEAIEQDQISEEIISSLCKLFGFCVFRWNVAYNELYYYDLRSEVLGKDIIENIKRVVSVPYGYGTIGFVARRRKWEPLYLMETGADPRGAALLQDMVMGDKAFVAMPVYEGIDGGDAKGQLICIICCFFPVEHLNWKFFFEENWLKDFIISRRTALRSTCISEEERKINEKREALDKETGSERVASSGWYKRIIEALKPIDLGLSYCVIYAVREDIYESEALEYQYHWYNHRQFQRALIEYFGRNSVINREATEHQRGADRLKGISWHYSSMKRSKHFFDAIIKEYNNFFNTETDLLIPVAGSAEEPGNRLAILKFNCLGGRNCEDKRREFRDEVIKIDNECKLVETLFKMFCTIREQYKTVRMEKNLKEIETLLMNLIVDYIFLDDQSFHERYYLGIGDSKDNTFERVLQVIGPALREYELENLFFTTDSKQTDILVNLEKCLGKLAEVRNNYRDLIQAVSFWYIRGEYESSGFQMYCVPFCENKNVIQEFLNPATFRVYEYLINDKLNDQSNLGRNDIVPVDLPDIHETMLSYIEGDCKSPKFKYLTLLCFQNGNTYKQEHGWNSDAKIIVAIHHSDGRESEINNRKIYSELETLLRNKGENIENICNIIGEELKKHIQQTFIVSIWGKATKQELVALEIDIEKMDTVVRERLNDVLIEYNADSFKTISAEIKRCGEEFRTEKYYGHKVELPAGLDEFRNDRLSEYGNASEIMKLFHKLSLERCLADLGRLTGFVIIGIFSQTDDLLGMIMGCNASSYDNVGKPHQFQRSNLLLLYNIGTYISNQIMLKAVESARDWEHLAKKISHQMGGELMFMKPFIKKGKLINRVWTQIWEFNSRILDAATYNTRRLKAELDWARNLGESIEMIKLRKICDRALLKALIRILYTQRLDYESVRERLFSGSQSESEKSVTRLHQYYERINNIREYFDGLGDDEEELIEDNILARLNLIKYFSILYEKSKELTIPKGIKGEGESTPTTLYVILSSCIGEMFLNAIKFVSLANFGQRLIKVNIDLQEQNLIVTVTNNINESEYRKKLGIPQSQNINKELPKLEFEHFGLRFLKSIAKHLGGEHILRFIEQKECFESKFKINFPMQ